MTISQTTIRSRNGHRHHSRATLGWIAALFALCALAPSVARAAAPCTSVEIVGVKGSGANERDAGAAFHGMGRLAGPVADQIVASVAGGVDVGLYGLPYPAADASPSTVLVTHEYERSEQAGERMLDSYLSSRMSECKDTKFVVIGYSQGAQVAGDVLQDKPKAVTDRIAALVMFGDPYFYPSATYAYGNYDYNRTGIAGYRVLPQHFAGWSDRVFSFCNRNDIICQGVHRGNSTDTHSPDVYVARYSALVASFVRGKIDPVHQTLRDPLDLAFVIDSTGSMGDTIYSVETSARSMAAAVKGVGADARVGLVDYKDTDQGDEYAARVDLDLTSSAGVLSTDDDPFSSALSALSAGGGGDGPEAVYSGLMTAIQDLSWRPTARKAIVLMGDAPGKDPEPITGYTRKSVLAAAAALQGGTKPSRASLSALRSAGISVRLLDDPGNGTVADGTAGADGIKIFPIAESSEATDFFGPVAEGSGGQLFSTTDEDVSDAVIEAAGKAAEPIYAAVSCDGISQVGSPVTCVTQASDFSSPIASYRWDYDGDGNADETTTTPKIAHVFAAPYSGLVAVTAVSESGATATASVPVSVLDHLPAPPTTPTNIAATFDVAGTLTTTWQPPTTPPSDFYAYVLQVTDASGALVGSDVVVRGSSSTVTGLDPGTYEVRVLARSDSADSSPASTTASYGLQVTQSATLPTPGMTPPPPLVVPTPTAPPLPLRPPITPRAPVSGSIVSARWKGHNLHLKLACPISAPSACSIRASLRRTTRAIDSKTTTISPGASRATVIKLPSASYRWVRAHRKKTVLRLTTTTSAGTLSSDISRPSAEQRKPKTCPLHVQVPPRFLLEESSCVSHVAVISMRACWRSEPRPS